MKGRMKVAIAIILVVAMLASLVAAVILSTVTINQSAKVKSVGTILVTEEDGTTPLTSVDYGQELLPGTTVEKIIKIKNVGNMPVYLGYQATGFEEYVASANVYYTDWVGYPVSSFSFGFCIFKDYGTPISAGIVGSELIGIGQTITLTLIFTTGGNPLGGLTYTGTVVFTSYDVAG